MRAVSIIPILWVAISVPGCHVEHSRTSLRLPDLRPICLIPSDAKLALLPTHVSSPSLGLLCGGARGNRILFFGGCVGFEEPPPPRAVDGLIDLFGSTENYVSAISADRVEIFVLKARNTDSGEVGGYDELAGFPLADDDAAILCATLTCDATYDWREQYFDDDTPDYSFRVKLRSREQVVSVDLSMSRGVARVMIDGREVARQSFAFGYETVAALLENHFPHCVESRGS
jgi:hypothetical protein